MPTFTIDTETLANPNSEMALVLFNFFSHFADTAFFPKNTSVTYQGNQFLVTQDCLSTQRSPNNRVITFIGPEINTGGFSQVLEVGKVFEVTNYQTGNGYGIQPQPVPPIKQIVKQQPHCSCSGYYADSNGCQSTRHNSLTMLMHEFNMSQVLPHLAVREPLVTKGSISHMIMDRQPGTDLQQLLVNHDSEITLDQRMRLIAAMFLALKRQIVDNNLVHLDIKLENLMVDLDAERLEDMVKIIDLGYAQHCPGEGSTVERPRACGTFSYIAPEAIRSKGPILFSQKSDVYSMSRAAALVLGLVDDSHDSLHSHRLAMINPQKLKNLFIGLPDNQRDMLTKLNLAQELEAHLGAGLHVNPIYRLTPARAAEVFMSSYERYKLAKAPANNPITPTRAAPGWCPRFIGGVPAQHSPSETTADQAGVMNETGESHPKRPRVA